MRTNLTLGDEEVVSLTGDIVHSTVCIGRSIGGRWRRGSKADFEGVRSVLNTAVARLLSDTDGVVLVGQMDSSCKVVALQSSSHSCEPLGASCTWSPLGITLDLTAIKTKVLARVINILFVFPDSDIPSSCSTKPKEFLINVSKQNWPMRTQQ